MEVTISNKAIDFLRWVAFIPGAALGAWLAWGLLSIFWRFDLYYVGLEPNSFFGQLFIITTPNATFGAAFVYLGAKIAPYHQRIVAFVLAGLGLLFSGFFLNSAMMVGSGWAIWANICMVMGMGAVVYSILLGETDDSGRGQ